MLLPNFFGIGVVEMKTSYPGCMLAGLGDSLSCSLFGPSDTVLLSWSTDNFFPLLVSTGTSFLVFQSTHTNMINGFILSLDKCTFCIKTSMFMKVKKEAGEDVCRFKTHLAAQTEPHTSR